MAYWVLPAFLVSLGAGPAQLGVIEGIAESVASFAKLFSGYLTDRIDRRKPLVVAGYFVANAVKPLLAIVTAWWHILLIRFTDRLAKGVRGAPRDVMVAESVGKRAAGIGLRADSIDGLRRRDRRTARWLSSCWRASEFATCFWRRLFRELWRCWSRSSAFARRKRRILGQRRQARERKPARLPQPPHQRNLSARVLPGPRCGDAVLAGKFQRHVPGDARAERRHPRVARAAAGAGLQRHLHARLLAGRMVQRSLFAPLDRGRRILDFRGRLFRLRTRALDASRSGSPWPSTACTTR